MSIPHYVTHAKVPPPAPPSDLQPKTEKGWKLPAPVRVDVFPSPIPQKLRSSGPTLPTPQELLSFIEHTFDLDPRTRLTVNPKTIEDRHTAKNILFFEESHSLHEVLESVQEQLKQLKTKKLTEFDSRISKAEMSSVRLHLRSPMIDIYQAKRVIWKNFKPTIYHFSVTARLFLWICRDTSKEKSGYPPTQAQFSVINENWKSFETYPKHFRYGSSFHPIRLEDSHQYLQDYIKYDRMRFESLVDKISSMETRFSSHDLQLPIPTPENGLLFIYYNLHFEDGANFSSLQLSNLYLPQITIAKANFTNSDFKNTKLTNAKLQFSSGENVCFDNCDMREANLRGVKFKNSSFQNVKFQGATLTDAEFIGCDFTGSNFGGGLTELTVYNCVTQTLTESVKFKDCILNNCNFQLGGMLGIELHDNNRFEGADFRGANLSYANLSGIYFKNMKVGQLEAEYTNAGNLAVINSYKTCMSFTNCSSCKFENVQIHLIETSRTNFADSSFYDCELDLMRMRLCLMSNCFVNTSSKIIHLFPEIISDFMDKGVNFEKYSPDSLDSIVPEDNNNNTQEPNNNNYSHPSECNCSKFI